MTKEKGDTQKVYHFYIYEIENLINRKTYVGQRKCSFEKHPLEDVYWGSGVLISRAKQKYGISNFRKTILVEAVCTQSVVDILETYFIALRKQEGKAEYNLAVGGQRPDSLIAKEYWSREENRKAHSDKMKLRWKNPTVPMISVLERVKEYNRDVWTNTEKRKQLMQILTSQEVKLKKKRAWEEKLKDTEFYNFFCKDRITEDFKKTISKAQLERYSSNPEIGSRISKSVTNLWKDNDYRKTQKESHSTESYKKKFHESSLSKEVFDKHSKSMKSRWLDISYASLVSKTVKDAKLQMSKFYKEFKQAGKFSGSWNDWQIYWKTHKHEIEPMPNLN